MARGSDFALYVVFTLEYFACRLATLVYLIAVGQGTLKCGVAGVAGASSEKAAVDTLSF